MSITSADLSILQYPVLFPCLSVLSPCLSQSLPVYLRLSLSLPVFMAIPSSVSLSLSPSICLLLSPSLSLHLFHPSSVSNTDIKLMIFIRHTQTGYAHKKHKTTSDGEVIQCVRQAFAATGPFIYRPALLDGNGCNARLDLTHNV